MRIGKQEKSLTYIFTPNKIKVNNTKQERTKKVQETRYKIIRIDEEDYGCEERPDDHVPMVSVLVKAIEPDDFGDFPERIIMMEDEIMYRRNLDEGDEAVIGLDGGLFPPGMFCNEVDDGENDTKADLQGEWLEDYLDALEEMDYYDKFQCTASKCPMTCCMQWRIAVDDETFHKWDDEWKEKVKEVEEGRIIELKNDGMCPFLNEKKLCKIVLRDGEGAISEILGELSVH